jgi:hypothetical protein
MVMRKKKEHELIKRNNNAIVGKNVLNALVMFQMR